MAKQFQVGDLVIMQNGTVFTECNGMLAVIIDVARDRQPMNMITMESEPGCFYKVKVIKEVDELTVDNGELFVHPWQIRPLRDSDDQELVEESLDIPATVENTFATQ